MSLFTPSTHRHCDAEPQHTGLSLHQDKVQGLRGPSLTYHLPRTGHHPRGGLTGDGKGTCTLCMYNASLNSLVFKIFPLSPFLPRSLPLPLTLSSLYPYLPPSLPSFLLPFLSLLPPPSLPLTLPPSHPLPPSLPPSLYPSPSLPPSLPPQYNCEHDRAMPPMLRKQLTDIVQRGPLAQLDEL